MHIAIVAPPLPGHYDPLRVLAAALARRGHRITFLHIPDARRLAEGFDFTPVGTGSLDAYNDVLARVARPLGFFAMIRATAKLTAMLLETLPEALARIGADAVIADTTEPAGGLVARHLGLPWAASVTGLPLLREPAVPPPFVGWPYAVDRATIGRNLGGWWVTDRLSRPIARMVERAARRWSLPPAAPPLQIAQCPPELDFPRRALPRGFHYTGPWREPAGRPDLPPLDDRPLIYCSLGSLQGDRPDLFAAMTAACARVGARAVVATGGRLDPSAALPGEPIVRAHWDQPAILPHCRAAILHGGFNTVLDALAAGVPMLIAPIAFEQFGTAARVAHHGLGRTLPKRLTTDRIERDLRALLSDTATRDRARRASAQIRDLGGVEEAATRVDALFRCAPV